MKVEREEIIKLELSGSSAKALAGLILSYTPRRLNNLLEGLKMSPSASDELFDLAVLIQDDANKAGNLQASEIKAHNEGEPDLFYQPEKKWPEEEKPNREVLMTPEDHQHQGPKRVEKDSITVGDHEI